jgi:tetraacyldisaccharide 4'-kinase
MYAAALGEARVLAGRSKAELAATAAARGAPLILIDDGFSHWPLLRDVDVVLIDATDPWGGRRMLPAGRLREPLRALQRAEAVVVTRLEPGHDWRSLAEEIRRYAPAARLAAGRHRLTGVRGLDGSAPRREGAAVVVTATGNPGAVVKTAAESGYAPVRLAAYRDHHWFTDAEVAAERARAQAAGETLLITDKDAVRWPVAAQAGVGVLAVEWQWIEGGDAVESLVFGEEGA